MTDDEPWQLRAACGGMDVNIFFPEKGRGPRKARLVCGVCEVTKECLDEGMKLTGRENEGIWGGLTRNERDNLRRRSRRGNL